MSFLIVAIPTLMVNKVLTKPKRYRDLDLSCPSVGYDAGLGSPDGRKGRQLDGN